jgi:FkbM family methyltransferase
VKLPRALATSPETLPLREPVDVRTLRSVLRRWPILRGKGLLIRLFSPLLKGRDFVLEVEPGVFIPADLDDYMVYWVFAHGYRSDAAVSLSRRLIGPGDIIVDVGAHIGLWAMGAARLTGKVGVVHAFEPVPENHERLLRNLRLNHVENVRVAMVALSDRAGPATMYRPSYCNSGHPSLGKREGVDRPLRVDATTLDDYCTENGLERVDFLKIDVEGAELLVFRGARRVLTAVNAPAIVFEVNDDTARQLGSSAKAVKSLLAGHGYRLFRFDRQRLTPVDPDASESPGDLFAFRAHHFQRYPLLTTLAAGAAG